MIKKYMALLKAQYTPAKLINYLTQSETHTNYVRTPLACCLPSILIFKDNFKINIFYNLTSAKL